MAATSWNLLQPRLGSERGSVPEIMSFPETSGQSFKAGTPVKLTTTAGTVELAEDGTTGFLGIAMEDATNVTNAARKVQVCRPKTPIVARCAPAGTLALPSDSFTQGVAYDFYIDADSVFSVDTAVDGAILVYESPVYDAAGNETYWGNFKLLADAAGNFGEA